MKEGESEGGGEKIYVSRQIDEKGERIREKGRRKCPIDEETTLIRKQTER